MADEDRMTLAPTEIYGRSDEEQQNGPKFWRPKKEEPPGNCIVYSLTIIVIVFAVCLILSLIFLRISKPEIETVSISTRDLRFGGNSSDPYFNATLVSDISIRNSNFGAFEFEDSSLRIVYADHGVVGETTIGGRRVEAHKTVRVTGIEAEIGSFRLLNTRGLDSDLRSGFLELTSVAEVRGRIKVMGRRKWKIGVMSCTMRLNLNDKPKNLRLSPTSVGFAGIEVLLSPVLVFICFMAALPPAPDMLVTLEVVAVLVSLVSPADRVFLRRAPALWYSDEGSVEGGHKVKSAFRVPCRRSRIDILRIWFSLESGLLRCASSLGVLRVAPSFVPASRLTLIGLASARRARWSRFSRVSVSSSPVKCVQVKGLQVSITSM